MAIFHACRTDVQGREIHDALKKRQLDVEQNRYGYHGYSGEIALVSSWILKSLFIFCHGSYSWGGGGQFDF